MTATNTLTNLAATVDKAKDIRDIRPPIAIPNYWLWLWLALGLLVVGVVAFLLWRAARAKRSAIPATPPIPPHVLARRALEAALALIGQAKPFVISVSDALRTYLEQAFQLRAPEQTTEEFLRELQNSPMLSTAQKNALSEFMQRCDLVKFARYEPRETELRDLHAAALELVEQTEPRQPVSLDAAHTPQQGEDNPEVHSSVGKRGGEAISNENSGQNPASIVDHKS